ncbi:MAG: hypothetical protein Q9165_003944 [Trypethelium subeluteriae]
MADQDSFHGLWADAVSEYEKQTDRHVDKDSKFHQFRTLSEFENAVDKESQNFGAFRHEHRQLYSRMATCIKPLQPIIELVQEGLGSTPYSPACAVFGAASYLLRACSTVSKAYDGVEGLFQQISDITTRLQEYEYKTIEGPLKEKMTSILAFILEIIGKTEAVIKRRRPKQWFRAVFLQEDDISASIAKLQKFVESELGLVIALTYGRVKEVHETALDVQADVRTIKGAIDDVLVNQRNDRQRAFSETDEKKLTDALKTSSHDEVAREHDSNVEKLTKGTGLWIRDDVMFQAWEQESAPILWVFGKPGVGKTMLAARTVENLQNKYPQHSDIPSLTSVSYISFKEGNPQLQDCAQLLKVAALQTSKANDRFKKHVLATIEKKQDTFASARQIWRQLFLDFFTEDSSPRSLTSLAFIIVDGLDEGPEAERVKFLACLTELVGRTTANQKCRIQVAVFARPDVRADPGFEKIGYRRQERIIEVTPDRNTMDIDAFIKQRLSDVKVLKVLKKRKVNTREYQSLAKQIYNSVKSRSQGMFLWAGLVFDQICNSPSLEAIQKALESAPQGLDEMLHHIFKRLEVEEALHQSYFRELLSSVFCAYRPLSVAELYVLLTMTADQHCYMVEDDLKTRYSSLFNVSGPAPEDSESGEEEAAREQVNNDVMDSDADDFDFLDDLDTHNEEEGEEGESASEDHQDTGDDKNGEPAADEPSTPAEAFNMPSHWYLTTVTFSHARIRDYLSTEGNASTRRWHDTSIVPDNMNIKHLLVALACIEILRSNTVEKYSVESLKDYARRDWTKHLLEVDFTKINKALACTMAKMLATFFRNGDNVLVSSFAVTNEFIKTWFCTNKYSSLVRKIITDCIDDLDETQQEWALTIKDSARALFRPLIAACARIWLTKTGWDDSAYLDKSQLEVWIMYAFSTLDDNGNNVASVDSFNVHWGMWNIPLQTVEEIANLEAIPKTEHWYAGVAWILMEADEPPYTEKSIEYFKTALEIKPGGWVAMEGLARCYGENLRQYQHAIDWMNEALQSLPNTSELEGIDFYLKARISDWKLQLGENEGAVESARAAYEDSKGFYYGTGTASDDSIMRTIKHYITALYITDKYTTITDLLHELDQRVTWEVSRSLWVVFLREQYNRYFWTDIFTKVGHIVRVTSDDDLAEFMKASFQKAVKLDAETITDAQEVWLAIAAADWQYNYARNPEESIDFYDKVVRNIDQSNEVVQHSHSKHRTWAASQLSSMHFNMAKTALMAAQDYSVAVSRMDTLAKHEQGSKRYYRASYPALIYGLWLRDYANADEETWEAAIKPSVKQALYLLSDEDPWNDQSAYAQLGRALLYAGDTHNAKIALGITTKPIEDARARTATAAEESSSSHEFLEPVVVPAAAEFQNGDDYQANEAQQEDSTSPMDHEVTGTDVSGSSGINTETVTEHQAAAGAETTSVPNVEAIRAQESIDQQSEPAEKEDEAEEEELNPKYAGFEPYWDCDGLCPTASDSYAELHFCRMCNDTCFCENCIKLVKSKTMPSRVCAADHEHIQVYPMSEDARRVTTALMEKRFEVQEEWLDILKREWQD